MSAVLADIGGVWDAVRPGLGAALCTLGVILALVGTAGVLRFPDFYTRLHAASVTDTSAATALLLGMGLMAPNWVVIAKLIAIWVFIFLTGPTATHAVANAAHMAGLTPWLNKKETPEPGEASGAGTP